MGSDNFHQIRKQAKLIRNTNKKKVLPFILIVCEGKKTEPNYFIWYKENCKQAINIEVFGEGKNTHTLVQETIKIRRRIQNKENIVFDQVWCVFDKDSFENEVYNKAFELCEISNIKAAYSNECFEIWYLLHFNFCENGMDRTTVFNKLDQNMRSKLDRKYEKNMPDVYALLIDQQDDAIRNAKRLEALCKNKATVHHQNPSTNVYELVEELNKYKK